MRFQNLFTTNKLFVSVCLSFFISPTIKADRWIMLTGHPADPLYTSVPKVSHPNPIEACIAGAESYQRGYDTNGDDSVITFQGIGRGKISTYAYAPINKRVACLYNTKSGNRVVSGRLYSDNYGGVCELPLVFNEHIGGCINKNAQPQVCAGNPVNIATGNKIQWFTDLSLSQLQIKRLYLQEGTRGNWRFSFQRLLRVFLFLDKKVAYLTRDNGQQIAFYQKDRVWQDDDASGYQINALSDNNTNTLKYNRDL
ncbi:DUF6531 domain-containing protein [Spartinivicinus poritis]|nr:DUF6531 domain-containing protein [Spartinivicinus sp. A2-2]